MLELINQNLAAFWILLGFSLLALEVVAFGFASGVLLFGSIGALITGVLLWAGVIDSSWLQSVAAFVISSVLVSVLLWVPLKRLQGGKTLGRDQSSDLIGREFRLDDRVLPGTPGSHRFSGITWRVEIDPHSDTRELSEGELVKVTKVDAGIFYVVAASAT